MFLSKNKKNNVYHCKLQFYYIKVGFKGVIIIKACFLDGQICHSCLRCVSQYNAGFLTHDNVMALNVLFLNYFDMRTLRYFP